MAIVSLPALGLKQSSPHLVQTFADAVGMFVGDDTDWGGPVRRRDPGRIQRRWVELASDVDVADALADAAVLHRLVTGNVRLLIGMVRADHPWRRDSRCSPERSRRSGEPSARRCRATRPCARPPRLPAQAPAV